jgi:hypothetical protein
VGIRITGFECGIEKDKIKNRKIRIQEIQEGFYSSV